MNRWLDLWRHQEEAGFAWLYDDSGPMKKRDRVKIIRRVDDGMTMLVEHPAHGRHRTACSNVDDPIEFKSAKGRWIPESDPRAELFLLKALDDLRAGGKKIETSAEPGIRKRTEERILWLLERNGWGDEIKLPGFQVELSEGT